MQELGDPGRQRGVPGCVVPEAIELLRKAAEVIDEGRPCDGVDMGNTHRLPVGRDHYDGGGVVQTFAKAVVGARDFRVLDGDGGSAMGEEEGWVPCHLRIIP